MSHAALGTFYIFQRGSQAHWKCRCARLPPHQSHPTTHPTRLNKTASKIVESGMVIIHNAPTKTSTSQITASRITGVKSPLAMKSQPIQHSSFPSENTGGGKQCCQAHEAVSRRVNGGQKGAIRKDELCDPGRFTLQGIASLPASL